MNDTTRSKYSNNLGILEYVSRIIKSGNGSFTHSGSLYSHHGKLRSEKKI